MREMRKEAGEARAFDETGTQKLLHRDEAEADESGGQRMTMKNRDAGERRAEQQKIDRHREVVSLRKQARRPSATRGEDAAPKVPVERARIEWMARRKT